MKSRDSTFVLQAQDRIHLPNLRQDFQSGSSGFGTLTDPSVLVFGFSSAANFFVIFIKLLHLTFLQFPYIYKQKKNLEWTKDDRCSHLNANSNKLWVKVSVSVLKIMLKPQTGLVEEYEWLVRFAIHIKGLVSYRVWFAIYRPEDPGGSCRVPSSYNEILLELEVRELVTPSLHPRDLQSVKKTFDGDSQLQYFAQWRSTLLPPTVREYYVSFLAVAWRDPQVLRAERQKETQMMQDLSDDVCRVLCWLPTM